MNTISAPGMDDVRTDFPGLKSLRAMSWPLLHCFVALWIFSGGFVLMEPSPYELMFLAVVPLMLFAGVGVHKGTLKLFLLIAVFTPFALLAVFQVKYTPLLQAFVYVAVTIFLMITSYFVANYVADAPHERMRLISKSYLVAALASALVGTLAYVGLLPGKDLFLLYDRAKAAFEDPNVYGPFLVLPALYALQRIFLGSLKSATWAAIAYGILFVGVFVSFSRAAWGYIVISSILTFVLCFVLEANARQKVRMLLMALTGAGLMFITLAGLLSIPSINQLFMTRASLDQSYDTGETGRFGRQGYAFDLALETPLGLGPLEFRNYRVIEEPHNTYVTVLHAYGWGGGLVFYALTVMTLWRATKSLGVSSPNRLLMIPLFSVYFPLVFENAIIDTDHWRHHFLIIGLIWGVATGYSRLSPAQKRHEKTLV